MYLQLYAPATANQKKLANHLGLSHQDDITQGDMHLLINENLPPDQQEPRPSAGQIDFTRRLGVTFDKRATQSYVKALIDHEIAVQSRQILEDRPELKVDAIITFEGERYRICLIGAIMGQRGRMRLAPVGGGQTRLIYIFELAHPRVP